MGQRHVGDGSRAEDEHSKFLPHLPSSEVAGTASVLLLLLLLLLFSAVAAVGSSVVVEVVVEEAVVVGVASPILSLFLLHLSSSSSPPSAQSSSPSHSHLSGMQDGEGRPLRPSSSTENPAPRLQGTKPDLAHALLAASVAFSVEGFAGVAVAVFVVVVSAATTTAVVASGVVVVVVVVVVVFERVLFAVAAVSVSEVGVELSFVKVVLSA